jgi:transposase-like protein
MNIETKYAKSKQQIANEYGICTKTLNKWLKEENIILKRGLITPKRQEIIYKRLGFPNIPINS